MVTESKEIVEDIGMALFGMDISGKAATNKVLTDILDKVTTIEQQPLWSSCSVDDHYAITSLINDIESILKRQMPTEDRRSCLMSYLSSAAIRLKSRQTEINNRIKASKTFVDPQALMFHGPPGHGKTAFVNYLAKLVATRLEIKPDLYDMHIVNRDKIFFGPYSGQKMAKLDEFLADPKDPIPSQFNQIHSNSYFNLEGSMSGEKFQPRNFHTVFYISNYMHKTANQMGMGLDTHTALWSRIRRIKVEDPHFVAENGRQNQPHRQPDFSHLRVSVEDWVMRDNVWDMRNSRVVTVNDLAEIVAVEARMRVAQAARFDEGPPVVHEAGALSSPAVLHLNGPIGAGKTGYIKRTLLPYLHIWGYKDPIWVKRDKTTNLVVFPDAKDNELYIFDDSIGEDTIPAYTAFYGELNSTNAIIIASNWKIEFRRRSWNPLTSYYTPHLTGFGQHAGGARRLGLSGEMVVDGVREIAPERGIFIRYDHTGVKRFWQAKWIDVDPREALDNEISQCRKEKDIKYVEGPIVTKSGTWDVDIGADSPAGLKKLLESVTSLGKAFTMPTATTYVKLSDAIMRCDTPADYWQYTNPIETNADIQKVVSFYIIKLGKLVGDYTVRVIAGDAHVTYCDGVLTNSIIGSELKSVAKRSFEWGDIAIDLDERSYYYAAHDQWNKVVNQHLIPPDAKVAISAHTKTHPISGELTNELMIKTMKRKNNQYYMSWLKTVAKHPWWSLITGLGATIAAVAATYGVYRLLVPSTPDRIPQKGKNRPKNKPKKNRGMMDSELYEFIYEMMMFRGDRFVNPNEYDDEARGIIERFKGKNGRLPSNEELTHAWSGNDRIIYPRIRGDEFDWDDIYTPDTDINPISKGRKGNRSWDIDEVYDDYDPYYDREEEMTKFVDDGRSRLKHADVASNIHRSTVMVQTTLGAVHGLHIDGNHILTVAHAMKVLPDGSCDVCEIIADEYTGPADVILCDPLKDIAIIKARSKAQLWKSTYNYLPEYIPGAPPALWLVPPKYRQDSMFVSVQLNIKTKRAQALYSVNWGEHSDNFRARKGDCGTAYLISYGPESGKIAGIHTAWVPSDAGSECAPMTKSDYDNYLSGHTIPEAVDVLENFVVDEDTRHAKLVGSKDSVKYPVGNLPVFGRWIHESTDKDTNEEYKPTMMSRVFTEPEQAKVPSAVSFIGLDPLVCKQEIPSTGAKPKLVHTLATRAWIRERRSPPPSVLAAMASEMADAVGPIIGTKVKRLNLNDVLFGSDSVTKMDMTTSAGEYWRAAFNIQTKADFFEWDIEGKIVRKKDGTPLPNQRNREAWPAVIRRLEAMSKNALEGRGTITFHKVNIKRELVKPSKRDTGDSRLFYSCDIVLNLFLTMRFGAIFKALQEHRYWYAPKVGFNVNQELDFIIRELKNKNETLVWEADSPKWDVSHTAILIEIVQRYFTHILFRHCPEYRNKDTIYNEGKAAAEMRKTSLMIVADTIVILNAALATGIVGTTEFNCIIHDMIVYNAYRKYHISKGNSPASAYMCYLRDVYIAVYGDDILMSRVEGTITDEDILASYEEFGIKPTNSSKTGPACSVPYDKASFCSMTPMFEKWNNVEVHLAALKKPSIEARLLWKPKNSGWEQEFTNYASALYDAVKWGEEYHSKLAALFPAFLRLVPASLQKKARSEITPSLVFEEAKTHAVMLMKNYSEDSYRAHYENTGKKIEIKIANILKQLPVRIVEMDSKLKNIDDVDFHKFVKTLDDEFNTFFERVLLKSSGRHQQAPTPDKFPTECSCSGLISNLPKHLFTGWCTLSPAQAHMIEKLAAIVTGHTYKGKPLVPNYKLKSTASDEFADGIAEGLLKHLAKEFQASPAWDKNGCPFNPADGSYGDEPTPIKGTAVQWNPYVGTKSGCCRHELSKGRRMTYNTIIEDGAYLRRTTHSAQHLVDTIIAESDPRFYHLIHQAFSYLPVEREMERSQRTPTKTEGMTRAPTQGGYAFAGTDNPEVIPVSVPVTTPAMADMPVKTVVASAQIPSLGLFAGRLETLLSVCTKFMPLTTKPIPLSSTTPVGTILAVVPYGIESMNVYAKTWLSLHRKWGGTMEIGFRIPASAMISGTLAVSVVPRREVPTQIDRTTIEVAPQFKLDLSVGGYTSVELDDVRMTEFYRVGDMKTDEDMVAIVWVYSDIFSNMPNGAPTSNIDITSRLCEDFYAIELPIKFTGLSGQSNPLEGKKLSDILATTGAVRISSQSTVSNAKDGGNPTVGTPQVFRPSYSAATGDPGSGKTFGWTGYSNDAAAWSSAGTPPDRLNGTTTGAAAPTSIAFMLTILNNPDYEFFELINTPEGWQPGQQNPNGGGTDFQQISGTMWSNGVPRNMDGAVWRLGAGSDQAVPASTAIAARYAAGQTNISGPSGFVNLTLAERTYTIPSSMATGVNTPRGFLEQRLLYIMQAIYGSKIMDFDIFDADTYVMTVRYFGNRLWAKMGANLSSPNAKNWTLKNFIETTSSGSVPDANVSGWSSRVRASMFNADDIFSGMRSAMKAGESLDQAFNRLLNVDRDPEMMGAIAGFGKHLAQKDITKAQMNLAYANQSMLMQQDFNNQLLLLQAKADTVTTQLDTKYNRSQIGIRDRANASNLEAALTETYDTFGEVPVNAAVNTALINSMTEENPYQATEEEVEDSALMAAAQIDSYKTKA
jgi:uncharacterized protein (DUF779 family)